ncbi:X-linked retinitis pigmentosa GTPase regulator-like isoform X1 [Biomphalaria glabrata]|uniref:X-linked retinitis pigmentosa GTPase regulator n=1 Tax=Biomphalaria glabrata TaxID=6526 RepID=A0A9W3ARC6_BIOGL|nr:X-linked retinitis pigmentosa GTPase regulator-like isoform X1 [Biomphalaria glabrata]
MAATVDADVPETGAVFTFGKSKFADNLPNKFWVKNDRVLQIACGDEHTALIAESGRVFMFGPNEWGQLGLGQENNGVNKPSCVKSLKHEKAKQVACGRSHTLISTESGHIYSCGNHSDGQLGYKATTNQHIPKLIESLPPTKYKLLDAGSDSSVALTVDGRLFMWGNNEDGKLGLGEVEIVEEPTQLPMDRPVVCVACGYYHTAIVTDDGKLFTMGESDGGKLGLTDDAGETNVPQQVTAITEPVKWVSCGSSHTVALTESGDCYVFGEGESGQLGLGTDTYSVTEPTHLKLPFKVKKAYCGQAFTALISEKGQLYTFGDGRHGKLAHGDDQFSNQYKPYHCKRFSHFIVTKVACGGCHMIVTAKPKPQDDGDVTVDGEVDEMKSLDDRSLLETMNGGSPTLSRSLSAREKRRNEVTRSFSTLTELLPALNRSRLSTTMPALKSQPKVNGDVLSRTVAPMLALENGVKSNKESDDEKDHSKVAGNKDPSPMVTPRKLHSPKSLQDGSDGDDEHDDSSIDGEASESNENFDKKSDDDDEDLLAVTNEMKKKIEDYASDESEDEKLASKSGPKSLTKSDNSEVVVSQVIKQEVKVEDRLTNNTEKPKEETQSDSTPTVRVTFVDAAHQKKGPLPTPRKKIEEKEKEEVSDEEDEDEEDEEEEGEEEKTKEQKKEEEEKGKNKKNKDKKEKKKKEEEKTKKDKKEKTKGKSEEDKSKEDLKSKKGKKEDKDKTEENDVKKDKQKNKEEKNKEKKKGKKDKENEEEENEKTDKKKKKGKKDEENEEEEENEKSIQKNDKNKKKGKKEEKEEIKSDIENGTNEKDINENKKPPAKKSRTCTVL